MSGVKVVRPERAVNSAEKRGDLVALGRHFTVLRELDEQERGKYSLDSFELQQAVHWYIGAERQLALHALVDHQVRALVGIESCFFERVKFVEQEFFCSSAMSNKILLHLEWTVEKAITILAITSLNREL